MIVSARLFVLRIQPEHIANDGNSNEYEWENPDAPWHWGNAMARM